MKWNMESNNKGRYCQHNQGSSRCSVNSDGVGRIVEKTGLSLYKSEAILHNLRLTI